MPSNKIASKLIEYAGVPIAAPSANVSGRPSGTKIEDILKEFDGKVSTIIDDGMVDIGLESTVVRVIDKGTGLPLVGAIVGFKGKEYVTDANGQVILKGFENSS